MDENLKHLLKVRLEAAIFAFAKAHNLPLTGKVLKWDDWTTNTTFDIWIRAELEGSQNEGTVM